MATSNSFNSMLGQLEDKLDLYLIKKAPALPAGAKDAIVKFGPWITLILIILAAPVLLALLGLGALLAPFSFLGGLSAGFLYIVHLALTIVVLVIEIMALPGLFKQQRRSWRLMYYATLVGVVQNVLSFNIVGLIIGSLLTLYILFQVKSYYTN